MKNAIGAVICLFVVYLHLLVVPPRNLRGAYYKNYDAANENRTCHYEWVCSDVSANRTMFCGEEPDDSDRPTDTCYGTCLTYRTEDEDGNELFRGKRCIEYCQEDTFRVEDGYISYFSCCYGDMCNN